MDMIEKDYEDLKVQFHTRMDKMREEVQALKEVLFDKPNYIDLTSLTQEDEPKLNIQEVAFSFEYMRDELHERIDKLRDELQVKEEGLTHHAASVGMECGELRHHMMNIANMMKKYFPPLPQQQYYPVSQLPEK